MQLKYNCIRDLLLLAEKDLQYQQRCEINSITLKKYSTEDLLYTCEKLYEAGFIDIDKRHYLSNKYPTIIFKSITWSGHQFLDNVRDNKVWKETKSILKGFKSTSIEIISTTASSVITNLINSGMNP